MTTDIVNPWLDQDGKIYSDDQLIQVSKAWSPEIWEQFLRATISGDSSAKAPKNFRAALEENQSLSIGANSLPADLCLEIRKAIQRMPRGHRAVIKGIFWEDLSEREIARALHISQSTVRDRKKTSLSKIERLLKKSPLAQTYIERRTRNKDSSQRSRDEEIYQTYKADLCGSISL